MTIPPTQATKGYRNRQRSSGAHDDSDAALLASIMRTDRESHRRLRPNLALTQQLLAQVRLIEILRRSIQLRAVLFRTYPQAVGLFSDLTSQITLEFLLADPTAQDAQTLSREALDLPTAAWLYPLGPDSTALRPFGGTIPHG